MAREAHKLPVSGMTAGEALARLESLAASAHHELAGRTDAGSDVLHYLAENGAPATRRAVAANPAAAPHTNRYLADDQDDDVRSELARKIARLLPGLSKDESDHLRQITIETLERLAKDQVTRVRAILAEEIKHSADVPKFIVQTLARDLETLVAAPILEYSPLLSDNDLLEIIATARADEVLTTIARRKPLDAKVADAIVSSLEIPAVAALLANPDARIREKTLDELAAQAEKVQAWHEPIALRTDLSKRAIWRIASFVGSSLIEQLVARYGLDEDVGNHLNKELRSRLQDEGKSEKPVVANAAKDVAAAKASGTLNESFVDAAAGAGQRDTVVVALATISGVAEATVRKIFATRSAKPITALVWHAGLSMRLAFRIQSFVLKLPSGELLPARSGVHFPMTEDEMRWHLGYFNIAS